MTEVVYLTRQDATAPAAFPHEPGCSEPGLSSQLRAPGVIRYRCPECFVRLVVRDRNEPTMPFVPATSKYRCREHPGNAVNWKGTGCRACMYDRPARR